MMLSPKAVVFLALSWASIGATLGARTPKQSPLASLKIVWYRSLNKKTNFASNCDFRGNILYRKSAVKVQECLTICEEDSECTHFTWAPIRRGTCWPRGGSVRAQNAFFRKAPGLLCGYVPSRATVASEVDWKDRSWAPGCDFYDSDFTTQEEVTFEECQEFCRSFEDCSHYTWAKTSGLCGMKSGETSKEDAFSVDDKNVFCGMLDDVEDVDEGPEWHVIVGGKNVKDLDSVEAFNWKTKEQCRLNDLPLGVRIHSSAILEGTPIICGGFSVELAISSCFKYDPEADSWEPTAGLVVGAAAGTSSVQVPNQGWFIFGGDGNTLTRSQRLQQPDGLWELGPDLHQSKSVTGTCIVQMNITHSVFLGGSVDPRGIVLLNWRTMTFTKKEEKLINPRWKSACALLTANNGDPLIAVAGGIHADGKGLEIWNPLQSSVEMINEYLPTESASSLGLNHAQLVPVNGGKEMILYGGFQNDYQSEIWKFTLDTSEWDKMGELAVAREEHIIFPLDTVACAPQTELARTFNF